MSVLYVALPVALALGALAVFGFIWAARGGQFDDLETPRWRMLTDQEPKREEFGNKDEPKGEAANREGSRDGVSEPRR